MTQQRCLGFVYCWLCCLLNMVVLTSLNYGMILAELWLFDRIHTLPT